MSTAPSQAAHNPIPIGTPISIQTGCPPYSVSCVMCGSHISKTASDALWWRLVEPPYNELNMAVGLCAECCGRIEAARATTAKKEHSAA